MNKNAKYKFVIVSPRQHGGGPIVLHVLCRFLCELGYDARIYYSEYSGFGSKRGLLSRQVWIIGLLIDSFKLLLSHIFPKRILRSTPFFMGYVDISVKGCKRKIFPWVDDRTIVVYPEIVYGNPLNSGNVVRWLLYYNRIYNAEHPGSYDKTDLFYCFREIFNDYSLNPKARILRVSYYDLNMYKKYNYGERIGKCYIIRKGKNRDDLPEQFDGIVIDNLPETEKVKCFNRCEYCISYDMQSAYTQLAALCGCISVLVPEKGKQRKDYRKPGELGYGEAFGFSESEIEFARVTMPQLHDRFLMLNSLGKDRVLSFAEDCIQYFDSK